METPSQKRFPLHKCVKLTKNLPSTTFMSLVHNGVVLACGLPTQFTYFKSSFKDLNTYYNVRDKRIFPQIFFICLVESTDMEPTDVESLLYLGD